MRRPGPALLGVGRPRLRPGLHRLRRRSPPTDSCGVHDGSGSPDTERSAEVPPSPEPASCRLHDEAGSRAVHDPEDASPQTPRHSPRLPDDAGPPTGSCGLHDGEEGSSAGDTPVGRGFVGAWGRQLIRATSTRPRRPHPQTAQQTDPARQETQGRHRMDRAAPTTPNGAHPQTARHSTPTHPTTPDGHQGAGWLVRRPRRRGRLTPRRRGRRTRLGRRRRAATRGAN